MNTKSFIYSKTFWVAMAQGILGVIVVLQGMYPEVGIVFMAKTVLDIFLRGMTSKKMTL